MSDEHTTLAAITYLAAAYPANKITKETVRVYVEQLADIDPELLKLAVLKCISDSKWFPAASELREAADALSSPPKRTGAEAWGDVLRAVAVFGYYHDPKFRDQIVAQVVESFGWKVLCMSENIMADRAHFIRAYETIQAREAEGRRQVPAVKSRMEAVAQITDGVQSLVAKLEAPK